MIIGVLILAFIVGFSAASTLVFEKHVDFLCRELEAVSALASEGKTAEANSRLYGTLEYWLETGSYTNLMFNASKIEDISSVFYEYINVLTAGDAGCDVHKDKLIYMLRCLLAQEKPSLGSIL